ncbi:MAG TPA: ABC transporter ATP-binding protein [bacterium]|nr:ABC transporter ATP-binding protein [bacterium]
MEFIKRLWGYSKGYKYLFFLLILWMLINQVINLSYPLFTRYIIDTVIVERNIKMLHFVSFAILMLFLFRGMIGSLSVVTSYRLQNAIVFRFRNLLYHRIQKLSLSYFAKEKRGPIVSRVMQDVMDCNQIITTGFTTIIRALITLIATFLILVNLNLNLTLISMIPMPLIAVLIYRYKKRAIEGFRQQKKTRAEVLSTLQENIYGIKEIKTFTQESHEMKKFSQKGRNFFKIQMHIGKLAATYQPLIIFISSIGTIIILWYGGFQVIQGNLTIGTMVAFIGYIGVLYSPLEQINQVNTIFQSAQASAERIFEVLDMAPEVEDKKNAILLPGKLEGDVLFKNVTFGYNGKENVLRNISFEAKAGETFAIVGPSGSGKTTLISLIPRFYDVTGGEILVDGRNIKDYQLNYLRRQIGIVLQEPFLFNGTVAENISFGKQNATNEEIIEVAEAARVHSFISQLPEGYDTEVGEQGNQLSGGQKQRIAIARALLKNPPILILDEATSSVDSETERLIQEALERLMKGRTSFVIAHRLSTIRNAKKIIVLKNGEIAETGMHRELLEKGGLYFHLYQVQFRLQEIQDEIPILMKNINYEG